MLCRFERQTDAKNGNPFPETWYEFWLGYFWAAIRFCRRPCGYVNLEMSFKRDVSGYYDEWIDIYLFFFFFDLRLNFGPDVRTHCMVRPDWLPERSLEEAKEKINRGGI